jgi:hypothetical protein
MYDDRASTSVTGNDGREEADNPASMDRNDEPPLGTCSSGFSCPTRRSKRGGAGAGTMGSRMVEGTNTREGSAAGGGGQGAGQKMGGGGHARKQAREDSVVPQRNPWKTPAHAGSGGGR